MNTNSRTVTRSIETDQSSKLVLQFLSDPRKIPQWAPGFADQVEADGAGGWSVTKGEKAFSLEVVAFAPAGTVDYLRQITPDQKGGAFLRVLPRPRGGCVIVMTLPVLPGATVEETTTILDQELQVLTELCASL
jgi:hypothetical protein